MDGQPTWGLQINQEVKLVTVPQVLLESGSIKTHLRDVLYKEDYGTGTVGVVGVVGKVVVVGLTVGSKSGVPLGR